MDTLAGSLDTFSLESVLRLIESAGKPGVLKIENERLAGRVFVGEDGILHATTREVSGSRKAAGAERRARAFSDDPTLSGGDPGLEQIVEVVVRLLRDRQGSFVFLPGVTPPAPDVVGGSAYGVEPVLAEAENHIEEWTRIESLVPSAAARYRIAPELPADKFEIALDGRKWMFLSAMGEGASVEDLAEQLGIFEFPAAMQVAEMMREGLLVGENDDAPGEESDQELELTVTTSFAPAPAAQPEPAPDGD